MDPLGELRQRLSRLGFQGEVLDDAGTRTVYGTDNSIYQLHPAGAVIPLDAEDVALLAHSNSELDSPFALVARGGGTGTNGQSLTNGLVVDTRRHMNRIVSVDSENQVAVVQPGVVLGQLNDALAPHGLFFAPHVSSGSRATIGGMVATDAAGKGSMVHGRTNRHVVALKVVLADGTRVDSASPETADAKLAHECQSAIEGLQPGSFPTVPRGFTGYNLDEAYSGGVVDLTKLLCGSEGTLAILTEVTVRLTPLPKDPQLVVIAYDDFLVAIDESNRLKQAGPTAIECLDERTVSLASQSPGWPRLSQLLPNLSGSLLLMEFEGPDGVDRLRSLLAKDDSAAGVAVTTAPEDIAAVWKVRADAVGLLGQAINGHRSVPFVEDCAVPPAQLSRFVKEFRGLLDSHALEYGMFGHADVGCVHVRPALNLYDPDHEAMVRTISDRVAQMVARFGGVMWGEHGRGFRGEYLDLDGSVVHRMRQVKTAFDPRNILNPGKLYTPLGFEEPVLRIDEVPLRIHSDRTVAPPTRQLYASAFACNGNGICHHWGNDETMCPSFKATADPRLSPKGRADLLRAWLAQPTSETAAAVEDSLNQCLSCSACTGRCPVQVDIPELKSLFLSAHGESGLRRRARTRVLRRFEALLPVLQRVGNHLGHGQRLLAPLLEGALGIVDLPPVPSNSLSAVAQQAGVPLLTGTDPGDATVVILPDAFTAFLDPGVLSATVRLLQILGERPAIAEFVPSGKLDHVKGNRSDFAVATAKQRKIVEALGAHEAALVVIEPSVALLHRHEYRSIDPSFPGTAVTPLVEYLADRMRLLPSGNGRGLVQLFGHCAEVSLEPEHLGMYQKLLERVGFTVRTEATSCCGMAGVFGHEVENRPMSKKLFQDGWEPLLRRSETVARVAPGYSCRSQAKRMGAPELLHPVVLLANCG